jgi:hypothetical protein
VPERLAGFQLFEVAPVTHQPPTVQAPLRTNSSISASLYPASWSIERLC